MKRKDTYFLNKYEDNDIQQNSYFMREKFDTNRSFITISVPEKKLSNRPLSI